MFDRWTTTSDSFRLPSTGTQAEALFMDRLVYDSIVQAGPDSAAHRAYMAIPSRLWSLGGVTCFGTLEQIDALHFAAMDLDFPTPAAQRPTIVLFP